MNRITRLFTVLYARFLMNLFFFSGSRLFSYLTAYIDNDQIVQAITFSNDRKYVEQVAKIHSKENNINNLNDTITAVKQKSGRKIYARKNQGFKQKLEGSKTWWLVDYNTGRQIRIPNVVAICVNNAWISWPTKEEK